MTVLNGCHVLLVDDDPDTAELHRFVLSRQGARVLVATSPVKALAALDAHPIDVLVADIAMPSVDGFELLRRIHERRPGLPALAVSAHAQPGMRARAQAAGFLDYLTKPLHPADLVRAARGACAVAAAPVPTTNEI